MLDEATAALDVSTEALLLKRLRLRPMTILFVAHRLATIQHCEQIFVLQHGRIIEQGSHSVLVAKAAHYYQLLQSESGHPCNM